MASRATRGLWRSFVTPEGVSLPFELASAAQRAAAFLIDIMLMAVILASATVALILLSLGGTPELMLAIWLIGFFALRNGWFTLFELGSRGATPGKRLTGLRVIARDGARLTGASVIARNAMREIEVFLPLSFLAQQVGANTADTFLTIFALGWSAIFLFFPLFNRDRMRVGDLVAGTCVVVVQKASLSSDLVAGTRRGNRAIPEAALREYGIFELQTLEAVLRAEKPAAINRVATIIREKYQLADDGDDYAFLADFYTALCNRLEQRIMAGERRISKETF